MVSGDIVAHFQHSLSGNALRQRFGLGEGLDVGPAQHLYAGGFLRTGRGLNHIIINGKVLRHFHRGSLAQIPGIGQITGEGGGCRHFRRYQVDTGVFCAAAALKVPVKSTQRDAAAVGGLTHTNTRTAGRLQNAGTGADHIAQCAVHSQHIQHLLGAGGNAKRNGGAHGFAFQDLGNFHHIHKRGVGAGADGYLIHLDLADLLGGFDFIGHVRAGSHGLQCAQVNIDHFVILRVRIRQNLRPVVCAVLGFQKRQGDLVRGEDGGGSAQFCTHVGDGGALRYGQGLYALAAVLNDLADASFNGHTAQHFQDHILGRDPGL